MVTPGNGYGAKSHYDEPTGAYSQQIHTRHRGCAAPPSAQHIACARETPAQVDTQ